MKDFFIKIHIKKVFKEIIEDAENDMRSLIPLCYPNGIDDQIVEQFVRDGNLGAVCLWLAEFEEQNLQNGGRGKKEIKAFKDKCVRVFGDEWQSRGKAFLELNL